MFKKILFLIIFLCTHFSVYALDYSGEFSDRSVLLRSIYGETKASQEQRELLSSKKLAPTTQCLIGEIKKGNIENVTLLLKANVDTNRSYMGNYPIYIASRYNRYEIVKLLRQNNAKLDRGFYSELYESVRNKNTELAKYLIEEGARVNFQDAITGNTILYLSLKNNMHDISKLLIEKGARPDNQSLRYIHKHKLTDLIPN